MTPQQKAVELREKFYKASLCTIAGTSTIFWQQSKTLALIAVDEILSMGMVYNMGRTPHLSEGQFYEQVKTELEKL